MMYGTDDELQANTSTAPRRIGRLIVWNEGRAVVARHAPGVADGPLLVMSGCAVMTLAYTIQHWPHFQDIELSLAMAGLLMAIAALWNATIRRCRISILRRSEDSLIRGSRTLATTVGTVLRVRSRPFDADVLLIDGEGRRWVLDSFSSQIDATELARCLSCWLAIPIDDSQEQTVEIAPENVWPPPPLPFGPRPAIPSAEPDQPV